MGYLALIADDGTVYLRVPRPQQVQPIEDRVRVGIAQVDAPPLDVRHHSLHRSADVVHLYPRRLKGAVR